MKISTLSPIENSTDYVYEYDFVFDDYNQHIVVAIAFLVAAVLGIVGNSLVIISVFASKKLQNITNVFVVNLSIADLITSLMIPWNAGILLSNEEYPIKDWGCAIIAGLLFTCVGTSLFTLASIAVNRLLLVIRPFKAYNQGAHAMFYTGIWIAGTWVIPFCFNIVPPLAGIGELGTSQKYRVCAGISAHPEKNTYDYIQALGCFPVPLLTIIICYTWIFFYLRRQSQELSQNHSIAITIGGTVAASVALQNMSDGDSNTFPGTSPKKKQISRTSRVFHSFSGSLRKVSVRNKAATDDRRRQNLTEVLRKRENTVTKNMFMVFIAFVICIVPFGITLFFDESAPVVPYATSLILLNACVNPILYGLKHPYFKQVFKCILTCKWREVPDQAETFRSLREFFTSRVE